MDFIAIIRSSADSGRSIGLQKLTTAERDALNELLNRVYAIGAGRTPGSSGSGSSSAAPNASPGATPRRPATATAFKTKIDKDAGDVLTLENGAVVEVTAGYLGYVGYRKDAVLITSGSTCRVWVEGKRTYRCAVLKAPYRRGDAAMEAVIANVSSDGGIVKLTDGSVFEVSSLNTLTTTLWLAGATVLILDDGEMVNLDTGDELITVTRLR
jgi:hypothetical protein